MTLKQMEDAGMIISVGSEYLTDDNVTLIRCCGRGTAQYWVRDDELIYVYRSLYDAYFQNFGKELMRMRKATRDNILGSLSYYYKGTENLMAELQRRAEDYIAQHYA
jgi:hypothetical protein